MGHIMAEQRSQPRTRSLLRGRIEFNQRKTTVECVVREVSESGARLAVSEAVTLPSEFELYVPFKDQRFQVQARWRRADLVGVQFLLHAASLGSRPQTAEALQRLEEQNKILMRQIAELQADHRARQAQAA